MQFSDSQTVRTNLHRSCLTSRTVSPLLSIEVPSSLSMSSVTGRFRGGAWCGGQFRLLSFIRFSFGIHFWTIGWLFTFGKTSYVGMDKAFHTRPEISKTKTAVRPVPPGDVRLSFYSSSFRLPSAGSCRYRRKYAARISFSSS